MHAASASPDGRTAPRRLLPALLPAALVVALTTPVGGIEWSTFEGTARGYPALRDQSGRKLADGDFVQWISNGRLHVKITYTGPDRRIEETSVFHQRPGLGQDAWLLRETRRGALYRQFEVNFRGGSATAKKREDGELHAWSERIKVDADRAFAGFGFTLAVRALRARLMKGEHVELQAVGFTPKPKVVAVDLSYAGIDRIRMSDRMLRGERYVVHAKLPWLAKLFVDVPDARIWLTSPPPAMFLRWEGPMAEPTDPPTRVDLLSGGASGDATPIGTSGR